MAADRTVGGWWAGSMASHRIRASSTCNAPAGPVHGLAHGTSPPAARLHLYTDDIQRRIDLHSRFPAGAGVGKPLGRHRADARRDYRISDLLLDPPRRSLLARR